MTVLHLVNTMEWGGVRRHILDLADGLTVHGVRSLIAAWLPPGDALHHDERAIHLPLYEGGSGKKSPAGFLASIRSLRAALRAESVQVLHMHSRYATLLGSTAAGGSRVQRVYTAHNTFEDLRWLPWYPDDIIAPGEAVRDQFLEHVRGARQRRLHVVAHGVEITEISVAEAATEPRFCFAGRLCDEKGVKVLYEALLALQRADGRLPRVDIIGDGPLRDWLTERVASDFPSGAVTLHGYVSDPGPLISGATALVFPSLRLDSAPYMTLEAMAAGVPVIASDIAVLRQLVMPDVTGLTFPAGDAAMLADALRRAVAEPAALREMGIRGWELVRERHDVVRMCAETAAVYQSLPRT